MHSPSRRAFLHGRRLSQTPWGQFCQRLRRTVSGEFTEFNLAESAASGRLIAQHSSDIHHVRALCKEYGVVLALDGVALPTRPVGQPIVWVRPGSALARFERLESNGNRWFLQPGCTLGELVTAGFTPFQGLPPQTTVAAWLADRTLCDYAIGQTGRSGLEHLRVVLGDGTAVTLGPFGEHDSKPLDGLRVQQMVSALFRLAAGDKVSSLLNAQFWPARYRLDALMRVNDAPVNLSHLLLGHGGDLGWVDWVVINADRLDPLGGLDNRFSSDLADLEGWRDTAEALDSSVKSLFDPDTVFSTAGQNL